MDPVRLDGLVRRDFLIKTSKDEFLVITFVLGVTKRHKSNRGIDNVELSSADARVAKCDCRSRIYPKSCDFGNKVLVGR